MRTYKPEHARRRRLVFVRALLSGGSAELAENGDYQILGRRSARLGGPEVRILVRNGVLKMDGEQVCCTAESKGWLRRQLSAGEDEFRAQHQHRKTDNEGRVRNLNESPLARLAQKGKSAPPYLQSHHVDAGERMRHLVERAHLRPRVTMSYSAERTRSASGPIGARDISVSAMDARSQIDHLLMALPRDCAAVVLDVCGFEKGLQLVESERGWPRRSAKLVLRIGLEQLAHHFGLSQIATGQASRRPNYWASDGAHPTNFEADSQCEIVAE